MKVPVFSPERCDTNSAYPPWRQVAIAFSVSVTCGSDFTLISVALPMPRRIASAMIFGLVRRLSSPTS